MGKAAVAGRSGETGGIGRSTNDLGQCSHRRNDDGMPGLGNLKQHGKSKAVRARDTQPDAGEGEAGPHGVAERSVVQSKPSSETRTGTRNEDGAETRTRLGHF
jgi:hypothetical protein